MNILVACEFTGTVRDAFARQGHFAVSCDILPSEKPGLHWQGDVSELLNTGFWDLLIAHPPCTRLANSGVRWLSVPPDGKTIEQMWDELKNAAMFYKKIRNAPIPKKAIENPIMHCHARKLLGDIKRHVVQPWWFGDPAFKATGFELHGLSPLIATNRLIPPMKGTKEHKKWSAIHRMSPGPNRGLERSRTYQGIADAMAAQWGVL